MKIFKSINSEKEQRQQKVGIFLDLENIAMSGEGVLVKALDYVKLRQALSINLGEVVFSTAYLDGPWNKNLQKYFNNEEYSLIEDELIEGGWSIDVPPRYETAVKGILRDISKNKDLFDLTVLLSRDREVIDSIKSETRKYIILAPADLKSKSQFYKKIKKYYSILPLVDHGSQSVLKGDLSLQFISKAIELGDMDTAAALLGIRLERIIDKHATSYGFSREDSMYETIDFLRKSHAIDSVEYSKLNKYRKVRNAAVHGDFQKYSPDDIIEFFEFLNSWIPTNKVQ